MISLSPSPIQRSESCFAKLLSTGMAHLSMEHNEKILINLGDWEPKHHIPNTAHLFLASKCISLNIQKVKIQVEKLKKKTREQKFLRMAKNRLQKVMLNVAMTSVL